MSDDKDKSSNWGGYRPGAGNKYKWKSGETRAIRIPIAIVNEVLQAAEAIDSGKCLSRDDYVTHSCEAGEDKRLSECKAELEQLKAYNSNLSKEVGELEARLLKANQQLQQVTKERDEYFDRIADIQLELDNLKDDRVTQSNLPASVTQSSYLDAATLLNLLKDYLVTDKKGRAKLSISKLEEILEQL